MRSAGINFGLPNTEYILKINDAGEATSCYNQDTDTEYIGGSCDYEVITVTVRTAYISPQGAFTGLFSGDLEIDCCDTATTKPITTFTSEEGIGQLSIVGRNGKAYVNSSFQRGWFPKPEALPDITGLPDSFIINGATFFDDEYLIEVTEGADLVALISPLI